MLKRVPTAGDLRDVVEVQRPKKPAEADEYGSWKKDAVNWETFERLRARVRDLSGFELFTAKQVVPEVTVLVDLRYFAGLTAGMRLQQVVPVQRQLEISAVLNPDGKRIWMLCYCKV